MNLSCLGWRDIAAACRPGKKDIKKYAYPYVLLNALHQSQGTGGFLNRWNWEPGDRHDWRFFRPCRHDRHDSAPAGLDRHGYVPWAGTPFSRQAYRHAHAWPCGFRGHAEHA